MNAAVANVYGAPTARSAAITVNMSTSQEHNIAMAAGISVFALLNGESLLMMRVPQEAPRMKMNTAALIANINANTQIDQSAQAGNCPINHGSGAAKTNSDATSPIFS
jgi:hypothetical protein